MKMLVRSPWLELSIMSVVLIVSYIALMLISIGIETPPGGMSAGGISGLLFGFFFLSFVIAVIAVIAGIGGGLIFTPIMLAFTPVDSLIVRATGLVVAMFSGLVSTGPFMRRGLGNLKICLLLMSTFGVGALAGAQGAIYVAEALGVTGEGLLRITFGVILLLIAWYFLWGGVKIEWPEVKQVDGFTRWLRLPLPYYEESLGKVVDYQLTRALPLLIAMVGVGIVAGFFGVGAGWAIVPAQNLISGIPLKVAAANSGVILGLGGCVAVWPYLLGGAIIPLFAAPWLVGQVIGGIVGAYILIKVKAAFVRFILIGIMVFTSYGLVTKGLYLLGAMGEVPISVTLAVLVIILAAVIYGFRRSAKAERR